MTSASDGFAVLPQAFGRLMPLHLCLDRAGRITSAGPTFEKLRPGAETAGQVFFDLFEVKRPGRVRAADDLFGLDQAEVRLRLHGNPPADLKGVAVLIDDGARLLMNLSFGISLIDAVRRYGLANSDFAPTDLAIEMLYLVEAKSAAMAESRRLNQRLNGARAAAEERALTDTLTGLKNRRALDHAVQRLIADGSPFALMLVDLDFFKKVNDTLGHAAGDHVLRRAGHILAEEVRALDLVARTGGDEFVLLFQNTFRPKALTAIARRIISLLEEPIDYGGTPCLISASIGVTLSDHYPVPDADRMLRDADGALYHSKRAGRARVTLVSREDVESGAFDAAPAEEAPLQDPVTDSGALGRAADR